MKTRIPPALIGLLLALPIATGLTLPSRGPLPQARPDITAKAADTRDGAQTGDHAERQAASPEDGDRPDVPTPVKKPAPPASPDKEDDGSVKPAGDAAAPKPDDGKPETDGKAPAETATDPETKPATEAETPAVRDPPPEPEDPKALAACLTDLREIGAVFETAPAIDDDTGCGMAAPVTLSKILPDVTLEPEATIRCETALQLARMTRDMVQPAAKTAFPDRPALTGILQASGYVCRNRNSAETGKISEHAHGNAIDIAGLRFGKDEKPVMIARQDDGTAEAAFQRAFNALACLYFTTVLSPGSDATHQDHMHLDVIKRKSGFRYCR